MISVDDKNIIVNCAKRYDVKTVFLFGSALEKDDARDIDIGVKGLKPELFFEFYGELLRDLSKQIDVVDLSKNSMFNRLVEKRGVKIYE